MGQRQRQIAGNTLRLQNLTVDGSQIFVACYPQRYPRAFLEVFALNGRAVNILNSLATPAGFEPATFSLEGCCSSDHGGTCMKRSLESFFSSAKGQNVRRRPVQQFGSLVCKICLAHIFLTGSGSPFAGSGPTSPQSPARSTCCAAPHGPSGSADSRTQLAASASTSARGKIARCCLPKSASNTSTR